MKFVSALICFALLLGNSVRGAMLLEETFTYTNGALTVVSGGAWASHSGVAEQVDVANGAARLTSAETEDVNRLLAGQPFSPSGGTHVFYARFTLRATSLPGNSGAWFAAFKDGSSGFRARAFVLAGDAPPGHFRLGLSTANNNNATVTNGTALPLDHAVTVVVRLANTNSAARLWVNPSSEADPSIATAEAASQFTVAAFALRQNTGMGALELDDLVVGTSFEEVAGGTVAPFITQSPASQMLPRGTNVTFTAAATGTGPLAYQWLFNNQALPGAIHTSLSLTNVGFLQQGDYRIVVSNAVASVTSAPAALNVTFTRTGVTQAGALAVLNYNAHGAAIPDWSTNAAQVQAIGRHVQFLDPDIITFQEIPLTNNGTAQMTNFVAAFRPGFYLATNSGNDGFIRSVILSRYPITRSAKWLDGVPLGAFGYDGFFTRDLFEAEIAVPGWPQPLHVFTTHLKSGQGSDETLKRAAEARAISNYFVNTFLPPYPLRPYLLTGDLNEDVAAPPANGVTLPTLTSAPTGLKLTTPVNAYTASALTFSIRAANLTRRYDYVLPSALLLTNIIDGEVFRADLAGDYVAATTNDATVASDHLPVLINFTNPFHAPIHITSFAVSNSVSSLSWSAVPGGRYRVEASSDLATWTPLATNVLAAHPRPTFHTNAPATPRFFRVRTEN